jgi:hypothetical protein
VWEKEKMVVVNRKYSIEFRDGSYHKLMVRSVWIVANMSAKLLPLFLP